MVLVITKKLAEPLEPKLSAFNYQLRVLLAAFLGSMALPHNIQLGFTARIFFMLFCINDFFLLLIFYLFIF